MFCKKIFCFGLISTIVTITNAAPHEGIHNESTFQVTDLATDLGNWMSQLPNNLREVPINYLAIPGTHDSFTVDISSKSDVSPDGEDILRALEFLSVVRIVMANWSKTQAFTVMEQLQAGIRFFDLRICRNDKDDNLYFCHAMYSTDVQSVLSDMASFLDSHTKEVVILDCQHFYNFTSATHTEVIQLLQNTFGDKLIPYQSNMDLLTLENLAAQNKQVLVIYRDSSQTGQVSLWPTQSFPTPWYDTMNSSNLVTSLNDGLRSRSSSVGYISQLILTPSINDIIGNALSTLQQKCAIDFEDTRTQWISNQTPGQGGVNVIIADFVDLTNSAFSKTVINLNLKLDTAQLDYVGIIERLKKFVAGMF